MDTHSLHVNTPIKTGEWQEIEEYEVDTFQKTHKIPKEALRKTENLNIPITSKQNESII